MDNDLMARRLRPPSEPMSGMPPTGPMPTPTWMQQTAPSEEAQVPAAQMRAAPQLPAAPEMPAARDAVPWDRPSDYAQATDTASASEPAWDRPGTGGWDDSAVYDDRAAEMFEPEPEVYGALVATAPAGESSVAQAVASYAPSPEPDFPPAAPRDPADDPDDAFAPVLDDVFANSATTWHEPTAYAEQGDAPQTMAHLDGEQGSHEWHTGGVDHQPIQAHGETAAIEPVELAGRGVGPTPPADLFADTPSLWSTAVTDSTSPAVPQALYQEPTFEPQPFEQQAYQEPTFEQPTVEQPTFEQPSFEQQASQESTFEQQPFEQPTLEQQPYEQPTLEQQPYEQPTFEQPTVEQPAFEQQPYEQPTFEQPSFEQPTVEQPAFEQPTFEDSPAGTAETSETDEVAVAVTAEQAWEAYEAFTAEQQSASPTEDSSASAAVLEIEVPQPGAVSGTDGTTPQQLVLRIELVIVDNNGRRVDPSNVAVRVSSVHESPVAPAAAGSDVEPSHESDAPSAEPSATRASAAIPTEAVDEPPWPTDAPVAFDSSTSESTAWLDPATPPLPPPPAQVGIPAQPLAPPPAPAFAGQTPWAQRPPVEDPLSALSAPPPPADYRAARQSPSGTFAPPTFGPPAVAAPPTGTPSNATVSAVSAFGRETTEPRFRAPPPEAGGDEAAPGTESTGSRKVALYTVGAGLVVVALALLFLQMMTNIL